MRACWFDENMSAIYWWIWNSMMLNMNVEHWWIMNVFATLSTQTFSCNESFSMMSLLYCIKRKLAMKIFFDTKSFTCVLKTLNVKNLKNHMMIEMNIRCLCESVSNNKSSIMKVFFNCVFKNTLHFNRISINIERVDFVNRVHATLLWNKKDRSSALTNHMFFVSQRVDERKNLIRDSKCALWCRLHLLFRRLFSFC